MSSQNHGFGIDLERCIGCYACTIACKEQNNPDGDLHWNTVYDESGEANSDLVAPEAEHEAYGMFPHAEGHPPEGWEDEAPGEMTPVACQHCENAPCEKACPVGATYTDENGVVQMNYDQCIGCRYCMTACPYNVRSFNWEDTSTDDEVGPVESRDRGVVEKCNWCSHRTSEGLDPACVQACPEDARIFGDLNDEEGDLATYVDEYEWEKLLEDAGTDPKVFYFTEETPGYSSDRLDKDVRDAELQQVEEMYGGAD